MLNLQATVKPRVIADIKKNFSFKRYKESISRKVGNMSNWPCQYEIYKTIGESQ